MKRLCKNQSIRLMAAGTCLMAAFALAGCEHDVYNPDNGNQETPNTFDFATTANIELNVNYEVPEGYQVLFDLYFEDPFTTDADGQVVMRTDLEPAVRRMTDARGHYSGKETISADHGSEAYIYTSYAGVPTLYKTTIEGNTLTADIRWKDPETAQTRAKGMTEAPEGYKTLGTWSEYGYPSYISADHSITVPAEVLKTITKVLPEKGNCPEVYRQSADFEINNPEGYDAEVAVRLIGSGSAATSTFGYYCYKAGASIDEIRKAPRCIILPNTLMSSNYNKVPSGLQGGEGFKLHYFDENGEDKGTVFPNGTKIGWFLLNDKFYGGDGNGNDFFSTTELNSDGRTHTASFRVAGSGDAEDFVVLTFEDWKDYDYNDVQFSVWSNPIEAITGPEIPEVTPPGEGGEENPVVYSKSYNGIVAFEDKWPIKGDYDLNDVIVKYNSTLYFNSKNQVLSADDHFELLWSGASYKNGFAYQLGTERTNVTTELTEAASTFSGQGLDADLSQATVNVLLSAKDATGGNTRTATYKIKNTLKTPVAHETFGVPPYNPFIMMHDGLDYNRAEVHLVDYQPTEKADKSLFHTGNDLSTASRYYVADGMYPFAIHLSDATSFSTPESKSIDQSFGHFMDWVKSNGTEHKDWYKE